MANANRIAKEQEISKFNEKFQKAQAAIVTKCTALDVESVTAFRAKLRAQGVEFRVIKNTLAQRAVEGTSLEPLRDQFQGPTAIAYTTSDPVALAKLLEEFAKAKETFSIKAGVLNGTLLSTSQVKALATVPSREVLLSRLVGALQSPYAGLVYGLSGVLRKLVYGLDAVRRKKEQG